MELYAATGEAAYHNYFTQRHCPRYRHWGWDALPASYGTATITYAELAVRARRGVPGALPVRLRWGRGLRWAAEREAVTARGARQGSPWRAPLRAYDRG